MYVLCSMLYAICYVLYIIHYIELHIQHHLIYAFCRTKVAKPCVSYSSIGAFVFSCLISLQGQVFP